MTEQQRKAAERERVKGMHVWEKGIVQGPAAVRDYKAQRSEQAQAQAAQQLQFAWKMRHHRTDSRANFKMALLTARVQALWRAKKKIGIARKERGARLALRRAVASKAIAA